MPEDEKNEVLARSLEEELLYGIRPMYGLYQIKDGEIYRPYRFTSMQELISGGHEVKRENYKLVHISPIRVSDIDFNLSWIFESLNTKHPVGFTGRSPSVSDVIVLHWHEFITAHFIDNFGFVELQSFFANIKIAPSDV